MVEPWVTILVAVVYVSILFAVASQADRLRASNDQPARSRPNIYALSLAVYCTTWTFFGSVGLASTSGLSFLAIYLGPVLMITLGFPLMRRIVKLAKEERIISVADFLGSRYGKNLKIAAVAAIIAVVGTIPYIALQLKAISSSVDTLLVQFNNGFPTGSGRVGDIALLVAAGLALFAVLFGTRHADATEHQHGLMLAVALESVVKLAAFMTAGIFVTWFLFDGIGDLATQAMKNEQVQSIVGSGFDAGNFLILTFLSLSVFLLLPRQFHVAVVENNSVRELERARWLFPVYLVLINLFVIPIAFGGILTFGVTAKADDYVLLLPILDNQLALGLFVFLGGLSAGMAMVVVASVALAIMISNDLVLPAFLRSRASFGQVEPENMERNILNIRRAAIFVIMFLAYLYTRAADNSAALASIGLVSFAAIAQLAPSFFGGLFWRKANARGAMLGMLTGFAVWAYCLLLPTLLDRTDFVLLGPFGIEALKPQNLLSLDLTPIANGVIWSLLFNSAAFIIGSLSRPADTQEIMQSSVFINNDVPASRLQRVENTQLTVTELKNTLARYVGRTRTERSFEEYWKDQGDSAYSGDKVDHNLLRFSEQLLASSIGASSSRLVHNLLLKRYEKAGDSDFELLDEASKALQFNRNVLQTAIDQLEQGITVFDGEFRLASWNRQFRTILGLPAQIGQAGIPLKKIAEEILRCNSIDEFGEDTDRLANRLATADQSWKLTLSNTDEFIEIKTSSMPEGGIVITWHNITGRVNAANALEEANETLEKRVEERTFELEAAKRFADQANASKTRYLAAAGHDILQPLNAARLYSATLIERSKRGRNSDLADKISRSLSSVEEILGSVLTIARLDTAQPEINLQSFPLRTVTEQLEIEFEPIAKQANLELKFVHSSKWIHSDKALLRRVLQNLISNALKFTTIGKILVGSRRSGSTLKLQVHDTGIGIEPDQQENIFSEFTRLNNSVEQVPGLGLGLSIVERIANLIDLKIELSSTPGSGTTFGIELPIVEGIVPQPQNIKSQVGQKPGRLAGIRILCIDNEPAILEGMRALLEQWDCIVWTADGLAQAESLLEEENVLPDVVLVDYHLDEGTGLELLARLRSRFDEQIAGVLITADRSEEVKQSADSMGLPMINKPVRPAALRAVISRYQTKAVAAE